MDPFAILAVQFEFQHIIYCNGKDLPFRLSGSAFIYVKTHNAETLRRGGAERDYEKIEILKNFT